MGEGVTIAKVPDWMTLPELSTPQIWNSLRFGAVLENVIMDHSRHADAEHDDALPLQRRLAVAERAGLAGAARGVVLRVEVEDQGPSVIVAEFVRLALLVLQAECRRLTAWFDECHTASLMVLR